jgi:hypothetical protein
MWRRAEADACNRFAFMVDDPLPAAGIIFIEFGAGRAVLFVAEDGETDTHGIEEGVGGVWGKRRCWEAVGSEERGGKWWLECHGIGRGARGVGSGTGGCGHGAK